MSSAQQVPRGLFVLPNEILLNMLSSFQTKDLVVWTTVCRRFHSLVVRLLHHRLQLAAGLDGLCLYLECCPPSAKYTTPKVLCAPLGTVGMKELNEKVNDSQICAGIIKQMGDMYTRFRPQNKEADWLTLPRPHPAGDVPGSRTYAPAEAAISRVANLGNEVTRTVAIDADMQFSQLETSAYLASPESTRGLISGYQSVDEGTIRVWREWSSKACESRGWTDDDDSIAIIQEDSAGNRKARSDSFTDIIDPREDSSVLWINTASNRTGIKFRVRQQRWRRVQPVLFASEHEVPVSYKVELEEIVVSTSHLLLMLEAARSRAIDDTGRALILGSAYST